MRRTKKVLLPAWSQQGQRQFSGAPRRSMACATPTTSVMETASHNYARIRDANPPIYNNVEVEKLECCGHVQKRMGRQLMNKAQELKTTTFDNNGKGPKGIGGRGRLKKQAILNMQGHYGAAIRKNVGNIQSMRKAFRVILEHRNKLHQNCGNRCPSKKSNGGDPNCKALPEFVMKANPPVFETILSDELLEKCANGGTQNTNESFHHLTWERCLKTVFCGRRRIELAVADATVRRKGWTSSSRWGSR